MDGGEKNVAASSSDLPRLSTKSKLIEKSVSRAAKQSNNFSLPFDAVPNTTN